MSTNSGRSDAPPTRNPSILGQAISALRGGLWRRHPIRDVCCHVCRIRVFWQRGQWGMAALRSYLQFDPFTEPP
jgi:hypothetical protein